jgi:hypothetical protein
MGRKTREEPTMSTIQASHPLIHYPMPEEFQSGASAAPGEPLEPGEIADSASLPAAGDEFGTDLTPDALMAYCQSRLDSIGDQVKTSLATQERNASSIQQIDQFISDLKPFAGQDLNDKDKCATLETQFGALIQSLQTSDPGCSALPTLITTYNSMVWSGTGGNTPSGPQFIDPGAYTPTGAGNQGDGDFSQAELQGYVGTLTDAAGNINSDSQLDMVHLQSLMSQQQTAVSLTTNLVQSLGDQENKIADNIGH